VTQRRADGTFAPGQVGNLNAQGGEKAIKALSKGAPLDGLALELKETLHAEIEQRGLIEVMRERAERHQAVADLFYGLVLGCKDVAALDARVRRFGWLNAKAFGMLKELRSIEQGGTDEVIIDAVAAAKEASGEDEGAS